MTDERTQGFTADNVMPRTRELADARSLRQTLGILRADVEALQEEHPDVAQELRKLRADVRQGLAIIATAIAEQGLQCPITDAAKAALAEYVAGDGPPSRSPP